MTKNAVGLIGLGLMGSAVARRLLDAGCEVVGYDINEARRDLLQKAGGGVARSIRELGRQCGVIIIAVLTTDQVEEVVDGLLTDRDASVQAKILICIATCTPGRIISLARRAAQQGVGFLDAPVSGTSKQVLDGKGLGLIGGDPEAARSVDNILTDYGCKGREDD